MGTWRDMVRVLVGVEEGGFEREECDGDGRGVKSESTQEEA